MNSLYLCSSITETYPLFSPYNEKKYGDIEKSAFFFLLFIEKVVPLQSERLWQKLAAAKSSTFLTSQAIATRLYCFLFPFQDFFLHIDKI